MSVPPNCVSILSPAKINLCLNVTGRRDNGYHALQSVVAFPVWGDMMYVTSSHTDKLIITGDIQNVPIENNLIQNAKQVLSDYTGQTLPHTHITLVKNIPMQAGLGGGSGDAASVLLAYKRLFFPELSLNDLCVVGIKIGADVPVCIMRCAALMTGIGEHITPLPIIGRRLYCILAKPDESLCTKMIFENLHSKNNPPIPEDISGDMLVDYALRNGRNDLTQTACDILPIIRDILNILSINAIKSDMSGSGSACFGLYDDEILCHETLCKLQNMMPNIFCVKTVVFL
jgi:4-diphosphocytidyl-2-C-methyl-D-erythritol kinase